MYHDLITDFYLKHTKFAIMLRCHNDVIIPHLNHIINPVIHSDSVAIVMAQ